MAYLRRVSNIPCGMVFLREFSSWIADFFACVSQEFFSVEGEGGGGGAGEFRLYQFRIRVSREILAIGYVTYSASI